MPRKNQLTSTNRGTILLVDDNHDYNDATRLLLSSEGFQVTSAYDGEEALSILADKTFDLVLLDYRMPGMDGADVVRKLRKRNEHLQVVLQTGYANEKPPRDLLRELDIQGYFEKGDGVDRLLLWVEAGIKAAKATRKILYHTEGLQKVLDASSALHRLPEPADALVDAARMGADIAAMSIGGRAREAHCAVYVSGPDQGGSGAVWPENSDENPAELANAIRMCTERPTRDGDKAITLPLRAGEAMMGAMKIWADGLADEEGTVLSVYAVQLAVALRNRQLYAMATRDPLTGVYVRKFYDQWIVKELRTAHRQKQHLSILMLDLDNMKAVNDTLGHHAGDLALAHLGGILKRATRSTDFIARYGGDEFVMILPATDTAGANAVSKKIVTLLESVPCVIAGKDTILSASIGSTTLLPPHSGDSMKRVTQPEYYEDMARLLLERADALLYSVKRAGKSAYACDDGQAWL